MADTSVIRNYDCSSGYPHFPTQPRCVCRRRRCVGRLRRLHNVARRQAGEVATCQLRSAILQTYFRRHCISTGRAAISRSSCPRYVSRTSTGDDDDDDDNGDIVLFSVKSTISNSKKLRYRREHSASVVLSWFT